jgi:hypothetical protein
LMLEQHNILYLVDIIVINLRGKGFIAILIN